MGAVSSKILNCVILPSTILMRIVESNAGRFRPHPFREQYNNVLALSDKLVSFEMLARDNLARPLYKFDESFTSFAGTRERPYRLRHRMLKVEVMRK